MNVPTNDGSLGIHLLYIIRMVGELSAPVAVNWVHARQHDGVLRCECHQVPARGGVVSVQPLGPLPRDFSGIEFCYCCTAWECHRGK